MTDRGRKIATWITLSAAIVILAGMFALLFHSAGRGQSTSNAESGATFAAPGKVFVRTSASAAAEHAGGASPASFPAVLSAAWIKSVRLPKGFHLAQLPWRYGHDPYDIGASDFDAQGDVDFTIRRAYIPWAQFPPVHLPVPAQFVTALCRDKAGAIWIATEGSGIFRYEPAAPKGRQVTQFTKQNTAGQLANNKVYALARDNLGRIYAGTLNHGVAVYNGRRWQDYDMVQNSEEHILAGPLGNHIFALKFDKYTDQMWICTDAGISIYQCGAGGTNMAPGANGADIGVPGLVNHGQDVHATIHHSPNSRLPTPISTPVTYHLSPVTFAPGTWHYITQADGLPQNPDCIAFAPNGTVYIGTQCSGIAIGIPVSRLPSPNSRLGYHWHIITGPWKMPVTATGNGLPSNLINCLAIEPNGSVIAGTDGGIAFGKPASPTGRSVSLWTFLHGQDFPAKVRGLWHPPVDWHVPVAKLLAALPISDYITALALTEQRPKITDQKTGTELSGSHLKTPDARLSYLWLAHRRRGCALDVWEYSHGKIIKRLRLPNPKIGSHAYITSLLSLPGGAMAVGTYGGGVSIITLPGANNAWKAIPRDVAGTTNLHIAAGSAGGHRADSGTPITMHEPKSATPPTQEQLTKLTRRLTAVFKNTSSKQPAIVPISDDWRMQGTWLGRYGRYWACLFACMYPPRDYIWEPGIQLIHHEEAIGPHHSQSDIPGGDTIRYYVTWPFSQRRRVLELPEVYLDSQVIMQMTTWNLDRRETEIDDHGEMYNTTWQGPDIYVYLHIPAGVYTLSLYFVNKDGHTRQARNRDYPISMIPLPISYHLISTAQFNTAPLAEMRGIAQSRVVNFWGGVWKRFIVRGPMKLAIRVAKNDSLDTILSGAMLDQLAEHPAPYYYGYTAWQTHEKQQTAFRTQLVTAWRNGQAPRHGHPAHGTVGDPSAASPSAMSQVKATNLALAQRILQILNLLEHRDPAVWTVNQRLVYLSVLRWCVERYGSVPKDPQAMETAEKCYYHLGLFNHWEALEKLRGMLTSRQIEKGLRWDGGTTNYRGLEFAMIRRSVAVQSTTFVKAELATTPSLNTHKYSLPNDSGGAPLAERLAHILKVPNRNVNYLPTLARVCDYLSHAVHPDVRWPIQMALRNAEPLVAGLVNAIDEGAPPTLLEDKILNTITLSGYSLPKEEGTWKYGNLRERQGIAAFMALRGDQLLRFGDRTAAAQWEIASIMLSAQDEAALGTVGVLGRYLPAAQGSPMYEPSALSRDIVRELRGMCESRLNADTHFYFNAYQLETLAREYLRRNGSVNPDTRNRYLANLKKMIAMASQGSLSRQYFFLQRMIAVQRVWCSGAHYRMATDIINAIGGWREALLTDRKVSEAVRDAPLRWIREASLLETSMASAPKEEGK